MTKKRKIIIGCCLIAAGIGVGYLVGKRVGTDQFVQDLIDTYENHDGNISSIEWPVFETKNKQFPDFLYEVKVECLGD